MLFFTTFPRTKTRMSTTPQSRALLFFAYLAIYIIWGTTYLAALWGLEGMKPFVLSTLRYLIAGVLLLGWAWINKYKWPGPSVTKVALISGCIMLVGGTGLVVVAETYIGSGHAAVVIATEPLWFILLDRKRWREYFSNRFVVAGIILGFVGIAFFSYLAPEKEVEAGNENLFGTLITLLGSVTWVIGTLYTDRNPEIKNHPHTLITGIQLMGAGVVSALIAVFFGEWNTFAVDTITPQAWGSLAFLIVMGSIVAYAAFMWLIQVQPPALVSTHTYVNPVVAVLVGWLLANERITSMQALSLVLVLAGVIMTRVKRAE
jgi:drug/metabolite transporter (DMT)-like permease